MVVGDLFSQVCHSFSQLQRNYAHIFAGNVQVTPVYLGAPGDVAIPIVVSDEVKKSWKAWATACQKSGTPAIVQLNHPGRQSPPGAGTKSFRAKNLAPSAVKMDFGPSYLDRAISTVGFGTPKAMNSQEIDEAVGLWVHGAKLAEEAGFKGVEIHGA